VPFVILGLFPLSAVDHPILLSVVAGVKYEI